MVKLAGKTYSDGEDMITTSFSGISITAQIVHYSSTILLCLQEMLIVLIWKQLRKRTAEPKWQPKSASTSIIPNIG
jgi:hypothetical protein